MIWQCKLCAASFTSRIQLFRHYRLQHSHYSRIIPLPCLYTDCICTFQTLNALSTHLSRYTAQFSSCAEQSQGPVLFKCTLCTFQQPFSESALFSHLRKHLKNHETVTCPYKDCSYSTNVYSSFNSHKSRAHQASLASDFQTDIVSEDPHNLQASISEVASDLHEECSDQSTEVGNDDQCNTDSLRNQLKKNVSSLFLKMQAILHVSNTATQEIVDSEELPQKAVVHISLSQDSSSIASTDPLSDVSSPERLSRWPPGPFPVPTFAFVDKRPKARHLRKACIYFIWF